MVKKLRVIGMCVSDQTCRVVGTGGGCGYYHRVVTRRVYHNLLGLLGLWQTLDVPVVEAGGGRRILCRHNQLANRVVGLCREAGVSERV